MAVNARLFAFIVVVVVVVVDEGPLSFKTMAREDAEKEQQRRKQLKKMGKLLAKIWELDAQFHEDLSSVGTKIDKESYAHGKAGWHEFAKHLGGIYQHHIQGYDTEWQFDINQLTFL